MEPDAETARRWLIEELSQQEYRDAQPNWFDRAATAVWDWLSSLTLGGDGAAPGLLLVILGVLLVAGLVVALLIFGVPSRNRRAPVSSALFGDDDTRSAETLRRAARTAADAGDWALAIEESFRAMARGLAERVILTTTPGTTARTFATQAAALFPDSAARIREAVDAFEAVRYSGARGTRAAYELVSAVEQHLRTARPPQHAAEAAGAPAPAGREAR